jgi:hypothetical protein
MSKEYLTEQISSTKELSKSDEVRISPEQKTLLLHKLAREAKSNLAYYELLREAAVFRQHLEVSSEREQVKVDDINKHLLKGFLSYASRLYSTGEISESAYISLVTQAAESYAERLVESKVAKALEKYELYFQKASRR